ncbi:MAG: hypothetical protein ACREOG_14870 [Gemmatimonadaceae bacterium]
MHAESTRSPSSPPDTRTLAEVVAALARRASDGVLVACAAAGVAGVVAIGFLLRPVWWLTPLMLGIAAFGAWGIGDRERAALGARGIVFRILRGFAVLVAAAAAVSAAVVLFVVFVGELIS